MADGRLLLLDEQDRAQWDRGAIGEGIALVREALRRRPPGRFALMAAIAAVHAEAPTWQDTDWCEVVALYDLLVQIWPSPVVALNRAVAVGLASGPPPGWRHSTRSPRNRNSRATATWPPRAPTSCAASAGRNEARQAYEEALLLTENAVERDFLTAPPEGPDTMIAFGLPHAPLPPLPPLTLDVPLRVICDQ